MMFHVLTQQGQTHQDACAYAVIRNKEGELAILENHIPMIIYVSEGYVKFVDDKVENFLVVEQAIVEFKENKLTILALEAQIGKTYAHAKEAFDHAKNERLQITKKENIDFSKLERELKENIAKGGGGHV